MNTTFTDHPDWKKKHPLGPVTFDGTCSRCGFKIEDSSFTDDPTPTIRGGGRTISQYFTRLDFGGGDSFISSDHKLLCSECVIKKPVVINPNK